MLQTLRTLIVDDEPLAIERLQILAGQQDGVSLVGTASDGASVLRMVDALAPDLVLCDIAMPDLDGLQVAAAIGTESGDTLLAAISKIFCLAVGQQRHLPNGNAVEPF